MRGITHNIRTFRNVGVRYVYQSDAWFEEKKASRSNLFWKLRFTLPPKTFFFLFLQTSRDGSIVSLGVPRSRRTFTYHSPCLFQFARARNGRQSRTLRMAVKIAERRPTVCGNWASRRTIRHRRTMTTARTTKRKTLLANRPPPLTKNV